jgi:translation elongation factor aEF-1 beta
LAKVLVSMKVFPSDVTVDLKMLKEKIKRELPEGTSVIQFSEEPVAFGLVALIAHVTVPEDKPGVLDEVENKLRRIEEVNNVETFMMRRW